MAEFEIFSGLRLGRYKKGDSPLHILDPRIKVALGLLLVGVSVASTGLLSHLALFAAVCAGFAAAKLPLKKGLAPLLPAFPFVIALALLQFFAVPQLGEGARLLWRAGPLALSDRSLHAGLLLIGRFVVIVLGVVLLSFVTNSSDLTSGIEHLVRPLQKLGVPAHELALVLGIAVRFPQVLADETTRLMMAQASRGADFGYRRRNFMKKMRKMLPLLVPLFLISLRRAQSLVEALESRCYTGGKGRTYYRSLRVRRGDVIALAAALCVASGAAVLSALEADACLWKWAVESMRWSGSNLTIIR
jgi:energy-coupling factor transport system permease protein